MNKKKLNSILLIDDDEDVNFYHKRLIDELGCVEQVQIALDGEEAIELLRKGSAPKPEFIFLDINMPRMDGWEFLNIYEGLDDGAKGHIIVVLLTTSLNIDDRTRGESNPNVTRFMNKYLTKEALKDVIGSYYPEVLKPE